MDFHQTALPLLRRALSQAAAVLTAVDPGELAAPTPCRDWDVRSLIAHLAVADLRNFLVSARGESPDWSAPAPELAGDWSAQFDQDARALLDAWEHADPDRAVPGPGGVQTPLGSRADQQIAELAMHTWDLATATGQDVVLDSEVAEYALAWSHGMLRPEFRGPDKAFGPEVPTASDAPAYDRLAAWFGRNPQWRPPAHPDSGPPTD